MDTKSSKYLLLFYVQQVKLHLTQPCSNHHSNLPDEAPDNHPD